MKKLGPLFLLLIVFAVSGCSTVPVEETSPAGIVPGEYQNAASIIFFEPPPPVSWMKNILCLVLKIE